MNTKKCSRCKTTKTIERFGVDARRRDGRQSHCLDCQAVSNARWYRANRERIIEKAREVKRRKARGEL